MSPPDHNDKEERRNQQIRFRNDLWKESYQKLFQVWLLRRVLRPNPAEEDVFKSEDAAIRKHLQQNAGIFSQHFYSISLLTAFVIGRTRHAVLLRWHRRHWVRPTMYELEPVLANPKGSTDGFSLRNPIVTAGSEHTFGFRSLLHWLGDVGWGMAITSGWYMSRSYPWIFPEDLPLVEKRSMVAETICDDIVQQLAQHSQLTTKGGPAVEDEVLRQIIAFGENCQRRRAFESVLRMEEGLKPDEIAWVPRPGIPPDFPIPEQVLDIKGVPLQDTQDRAEAWTTDQEEEDRRKRK